MMGEAEERQKQEQKYIKMTTTPVEKLICSLAGPTIVSMLVTSFYNMADTFFVGKIGTSATGAVGIVFSVMAIIQAFGFFFGHGSGNYVSRKLGEKDFEEASRMAATGFVSAFLAPRQILPENYFDWGSLHDSGFGSEQSAAVSGERLLRHDRNHLRGCAQHRFGSTFYLCVSYGSGRRGAGHHYQPVCQLFTAASGNWDGRKRSY